VKIEKIAVSVLGGKTDMCWDVSVLGGKRDMY
jgi:hypothetical protein